jgi:hypothetical protein
VILLEFQIQARLSDYVFSGNDRARWPVSLNMALATAGAKGGTAGSPTPSGNCVLGMIQVSTTGDCAKFTKG